MELFDLIGCKRVRTRFSVLAKNVNQKEISEISKRYSKMYEFMFKFKHPEGINAVKKLNENPNRR